jgi:hypothetical protein
VCNRVPHRRPLLRLRRRPGRPRHRHADRRSWCSRIIRRCHRHGARQYRPARQGNPENGLPDIGGGTAGTTNGSVVIMSGVRRAWLAGNPGIGDVRGMAGSGSPVAGFDRDGWSRLWVGSRSVRSSPISSVKMPELGARNASNHKIGRWSLMLQNRLRERP